MLLLSVANSVNMTLFERTREFGTLLALGNRPSDVFWLVMTEGFVIGLIGASAGVLLGCAIGNLVSAAGIPMPPPPNANVGYTAHILLLPKDILTAWLIGFRRLFWQQLCQRGVLRMLRLWRRYATESNNSCEILHIDNDCCSAMYAISVMITTY